MKKNFGNAMLVALIAWVMISSIAFGIFYAVTQNKQETSIKEQSEIIVQQINEVNKMITLEGNFAEVYDLDQSQKLFYELIPIPKKALVIAKAKVYIAYDMSQVDYRLDEENKTVYISNIPKPEVIVDPQIEFYDLKANILPFTKKELTTINQRATDLLRKEAEKQGFIDLAEEKLALNLKQVMVVAESQGWKVEIEKDIN